MMGVHQEFPGHQSHQPLFHLQYVLARRNAGTVGHPENVGIYRHGGLTESGI